MERASSGNSEHAWVQRLRGKFLVFDGPDGSGKSTQFSRFSRFCAEHAVRVCEVREPGGTPIGEKVREILLDPENTDMTLPCEMLLYMASRAQLVLQRVQPALERGELVLADRFISSTLAYQGTAGGLRQTDIVSVGKVAMAGVEPNLTIVFDVDERTAAGRLNPLLDRMEQKGVDFHRRVRRGYLDQADNPPYGQYLVIDASPEPEMVFRSLLKGLRSAVPASGA